MAQVILYVPAMVGVNSKTTVCPFVNTSTFLKDLELSHSPCILAHLLLPQFQTVPVVLRSL